MIEVNSRQHPSAALLYRHLLTGNDQARPRAAQHSRPVVLSLLRDAGSASRDCPTVLATPSNRFPESRSTYLRNKPPASKSP